MSTRANILIKDEDSQLWFYRHSDGYPSVTLPQLKKFMRWVKSKRIRDNVGQAAGWLIVLGNEEYRGPKSRLDYGSTFEPNHTLNSVGGWKVGAFEPTTDQHGDIEYLYTLDLTKPSEILCKNIYNGKIKTYKV